VPWAVRRRASAMCSTKAAQCPWSGGPSRFEVAARSRTPGRCAFRETHAHTHACTHFHIERDMHAPKHTHALARRSSRLRPRTAHAHMCTLTRACCVRLAATCSAAHSGPGRAMTGRRVRRDPEGPSTCPRARSCSTAWRSPTQARCSSRTAAHGWRGRPGLGGPAVRAALRRCSVHGK
jgi:hypothetical protein